VYTLVSAVVKEHRDCGARCLRYIGSALYVIQIFGQPMSKLFPILDTLAVGKNSGRTNLIERFNCTLRQRVSRLVRDALSFSKKLDNHIGAIWYFVHHYNTSLLF
jgi:hypothetical protein